MLFFCFRPLLDLRSWFPRGGWFCFDFIVIATQTQLSFGGLASGVRGFPFSFSRLLSPFRCRRPISAVYVCMRSLLNGLPFFATAVHSINLRLMLCVWRGGLLKTRTHSSRNVARVQIPCVRYGASDSIYGRTTTTSSTSAKPIV